jgi:uncharacterized RDD family membrane protein YckC
MVLTGSRARAAIGSRVSGPPSPEAGGDRLVSGEAVELEVRTARLGSRAVALLLDIMIEIVLLFVLTTGLGGFLAAIGGLADDALVAALFIVLIVVILVGYPVTAETLFDGRTLGKAALGIRVVRIDGGRVRFRHALTRALVGAAVEWPGVLSAPIAPITWMISLTTMLVQPQSRRIGDLAAGTLVVHERAPAAWRWVPAMPQALAPWAAVLDLTGLSDSLALAVRHYLARNRRFAEPTRSRLGHALASEVAACTSPPPPPGTPGWAYLAAVLAERHRRSALRLAATRHVTASVWAAVRPPEPSSPQKARRRRRWWQRRPAPAVPTGSGG